MSQEKELIFKLRQRFLALFIILTIIALLLVNYIEKQITDSYLEQTTKTYERAYNTIYTQYKELGDVVFTGLLKIGNVKEKFKNIQDLTLEEQAKIRKELYDKTITRYKTLQLKHIKSVNFILPDNSMFLKVKKPSHFGQQLTKKRHVIKYIHQHKKPIDSYEVGRYGAGFRFAYPIIDEGKYLGIIGITFGAEAITAGIMRQYDVLSNFFINQKNFHKDVLTKKAKLYKQSHHKEFIFDLKVLKELNKASKSDLSKLKPNPDLAKILYNNMISNQSAASYYDRNLKMVFTHIPVFHKLTNEKEGVLTIRSKLDAINILHANYIVIHLLLVILIAAILYVIYQHNIKLVKERKSVQETMAKDKQLLEQAKMAQMGEMIGNIAHQWRQPLSTISTAASGIKVNQEYNILKPEDIPHHMDIIVKNVDYLSRTIDTFRDFIKEEATTTEITLHENLDKTLEIISATLSQNHIKLINEIDYDHPVKLQLISGALSQVIVNIINNSKDAIVSNKTTDGWVKIGTHLQASNAIITIEDNGGGIPEEILAKIFDPYFTTKHQSQGTGLGLFMSQKIVTQYFDGELYVHNTKNGAKFFIKIPLNKEE